MNDVARIWEFVLLMVVACAAVGITLTDSLTGSSLTLVEDDVAQLIYGADCGVDSGNCDVGSCTGGSCITSGSESGAPKGSRTCSSNCTCGLTIGTCSSSE